MMEIEVHCLDRSRIRIRLEMRVSEVYRARYCLAGWKCIFNSMSCIFMIIAGLAVVW